MMHLGRRSLILLFSALPLLAAEPRLSPEDREKARKWLDDSRTQFLGAIDGVTPEQWTWKPAPDRWSIGEIAEHVVLGEASQFANVKRALATEPNAAWEEQTKGKTALLEMALAGRMGKAQAPEAIVPKGGMTPATVRERFARQHAEIAEFAAKTELLLKQHTVNSPFFGPLSAYQWLLYAPLHTVRHCQQIAEVKGTAGYPRLK
jgi:hypothetical protein